MLQYQTMFFYGKRKGILFLCVILYQTLSGYICDQCGRAIKALVLVGINFPKCPILVCNWVLHPNTYHLLNSVVHQKVQMGAKVLTRMPQDGVSETIVRLHITYNISSSLLVLRHNMFIIWFTIL